MGQHPEAAGAGVFDHAFHQRQRGPGAFEVFGRDGVIGAGYALRALDEGDMGWPFAAFGGGDIAALAAIRLAADGNRGQCVRSP